MSNPFRRHKSRLALLLFLTSMCTLLQAQTFPDFPFEGHWPYGPSDVVEARTIGAQDLVFYGEGTVLRIADVTNRANPVVISEVRTNYAVRSLDISDDGTLLAVADHMKWITIVDLSNPASPTIAGRYEQADGQRPYGIAFASNSLLIAAITPAGVWALDISDPGNITIAGTYFEPGTDFVFDLDVFQDIAVVADDDDGVSLVDFSDTNNMQLVDRYAGASNAVQITLVGNRAYAARAGDGLSVMDIDTMGATPAIVPVGDLDTSGFPEGFASVRRVEFTTDGLAVIADPLIDNGLVLADISNLAAPTIVGNIWRGRLDAAVLGNTAFSIKPVDFNPIELDVVDVSSANMNAPETITALPLFANSDNISINNGEVAVANTSAGVVLIDVTNTDEPLTSQWIPFPSGDVRDVVRVNDTLVVITSGDEFDLVDVSDINNPVVETPYDIGGGALTFDAHPIPDSTWVAVTANTQGIQIIDVDNPASPQLITSWIPSSGFVQRVYVENDRLIAAGQTDAWILTLNRNIPAIIEEGSFSTSQLVEDVHLQGDLAFLAAGINGMEIWDVSTPASASMVSQFDPFPISAHGVSVWGSTAYVASDTYYGLMAVDITNPGMPMLLDNFDSPGSAENVAVNENILAMADLDMGVRIWSNIQEFAFFKDGFEAIMPTGAE